MGGPVFGVNYRYPWDIFSAATSSSEDPIRKETNSLYLGERVTLGRSQLLLVLFDFGLDISSLRSNGLERRLVARLAKRCGKTFKVTYPVGNRGKRVTKEVDLSGLSDLEALIGSGKINPEIVREEFASLYVEDVLAYPARKIVVELMVNEEVYSLNKIFGPLRIVRDRILGLLPDDKAEEVHKHSLFYVKNIRTSDEKEGKRVFLEVKYHKDMQREQIVRILSQVGYTTTMSLKEYQRRLIKEYSAFNRALTYFGIRGNRIIGRLFNMAVSLEKRKFLSNFLN